MGTSKMMHESKEKKQGRKESKEMKTMTFKKQMGSWEQKYLF